MFVVRRVIPEESIYDAIPEPHEHYLAAFAAAEDAEAFARRHNQDHIRTHLPTVLPGEQWPFEDGWDAYTSMPEPVLRDWLRDHDIEPPAAPKKPFQPPKRVRGQSAADFAEYLAREEQGWAVLPWRDWWEKTVVPGKLPREKLAVVWQALDRVRFFEVAEAEGKLPAGVERVFAVVRRYWEYDDERYSGENTVTTAYRTRRAAEAALAKRAATDEAAMEDGDYDWGDGAPEYVVIELPVPGGE